MKLNTKAFGLNFIPVMDNLPESVKLEASDLLIIGYDIAPAERLSPADKAKHAREWEKKFNLSKEEIKAIKSIHPAVVGLCANKGKEPYAFSGDIFYQNPNEDLVSVPELAAAVENAVRLACKSGRRPTRLLVFRDGVSEGRQDVVSTVELGAIRQGYYAGVQRDEVRTLKSFHLKIHHFQKTANLSVKITLIVGTKNHLKRYYRNDGRENTRVGDSISTPAARSDVQELYFQNHHPLKARILVKSNKIFFFRECRRCRNMISWSMRLDSLSKK
jgi:hypothetical protein